MNLGRLTKQLEIDEGRSLRVYQDSLGYKTVGVGHLITSRDSEALQNARVGSKISDSKCAELFLEDLGTAINDAVIIFADIWESFPDEAQEVFVNMLFNLGRPRFLTFKKMLVAAYMAAEDPVHWDRVADEMLDSKWAEQVGNRSSRLASKLRSLVKSAEV